MRANGRPSGPVLTSRFLFVPDHSARVPGQPPSASSNSFFYKTTFHFDQPISTREVGACYLCLVIDQASKLSTVVNFCPKIRFQGSAGNVTAETTTMTETKTTETTTTTEKTTTSTQEKSKMPTMISMMTPSTSAIQGRILSTYDDTELGHFADPATPVRSNPHSSLSLPPAYLPSHYGTKPGHFETLKIYCSTSEGMSKVSERVNE